VDRKNVWVRLCPVLLGVALLGVVASPAPAQAARPARSDSASGSGTTSFFGQFEIDARSGPNGERPRGEISVSGGALSFEGPVTCLNVARSDTGTRAMVNIQTSQFGLVTIALWDNARTGIADVFEAVPTTRVPTDCSPFADGATRVTETVSSGDIAVVDGRRWWERARL
jgi:hypothetical protein